MSEKRKKINEKSKKQKPQPQTDSELLEQYFASTMENQLLRAQNKHTLKIGNIVLEVLPTSSKDDLGAVFKHFTKFAKEMKKLHNDAHLLCCESGEVSSSLMDQMIG